MRLGEKLGEHSALGVAVNAGIVVAVRDEHERQNERPRLTPSPGRIIGADDKSARSAVIKAAKDKKDDVLAANALFALGLHASDKKAWAEIETGLSHSSARRRQAAALGLALGRASDRIEAVKAAREAEQDEEVQATLDAVLTVLEGGPITGLAEIAAKVTDSEIPRPRFFGGQTGAEEAPSE